ncbi:hypothetical protein ACJX0J_041400, partial [Zea mays]
VVLESAAIWGHIFWSRELVVLGHWQSKYTVGMYSPIHKLKMQVLKAPFLILQVKLQQNSKSHEEIPSLSDQYRRLLHQEQTLVFLHITLETLGINVSLKRDASIETGRGKEEEGDGEDLPTLGGDAANGNLGCAQITAATAIFQFIQSTRAGTCKLGVIVQVKASLGASKNLNLIDQGGVKKKYLCFLMINLIIELDDIFTCYNVICVFHGHGEGLLIEGDREKRSAFTPFFFLLLADGFLRRLLLLGGGAVEEGNQYFHPFFNVGDMDEPYISSLMQVVLKISMLMWNFTLEILKGNLNFQNLLKNEYSKAHFKETRQGALYDFFFHVFFIAISKTKLLILLATLARFWSRRLSSKELDENYVCETKKQHTQLNIISEYHNTHLLDKLTNNIDIIIAHSSKCEAYWFLTLEKDIHLMLSGNNWLKTVVNVIEGMHL